MIYLRQVKRKCSVRGCKNTDCYAVSRTREVGNTVIICKNCLGMALNAVDEIDPKTRSNVPPVDNNDVPPLFFNAKVKKTEAEEAKAKTEAKETFVCPECGKICASKIGLQSHVKTHKKGE